MKKFLTFALIALSCILAAVSCVKTNKESTSLGYSNIELTTVENQSITLTYKLSILTYSVTCSQEWKFSNGTCTSSILTEVCSMPGAVQDVIASLNGQYGEDKITINGNTITIDSSEEFVGRSYEDVLKAVQVIKAGFESGFRI